MMREAAIQVLFIDDDEALGYLVKKDLERHGFRAEIALDGASGLRRIAAGGIDAVVLDHHLPDQEGLSILVEIQKLPDPPPVIYLTGAQDSKTAVAALKAGAIDYVIKDVRGEFLALLPADIEAGVQSANLRRAKEAAEAEIVAARDRYKALAQEREVLLREVSHRVSNDSVETFSWNSHRRRYLQRYEPDTSRRCGTVNDSARLTQRRSATAPHPAASPHCVGCSLSDCLYLLRGVRSTSVRKC